MNYLEKYLKFIRSGGLISTLFLVFITLAAIFGFIVGLFNFVKGLFV